MITVYPVVMLVGTKKVLELINDIEEVYIAVYQELYTLLHVF